MSARDALSATYAYLVGLVGEEKMEELLTDTSRPEVPDDNREAIAALRQLGSLPRVGRA